MDAAKDAALLWIAREGLKAPLPEPWKTCRTEDGSGKVYYFNFDSGESIWEHPCDLKYKKKFADEKQKLEEQAKEQATAAASPKAKSGRSSKSSTGDKKEKKKRVRLHARTTITTTTIITITITTTIQSTPKAAPTQAPLLPPPPPTVGVVQEEEEGEACPRGEKWEEEEQGRRPGGFDVD
jgi:hypothetical protein